MEVLGILCQEWGTETNTFIFCDLTKWTVSNMRSYYGNITSSNAPISSLQVNVTILILQMRDLGSERAGNHPRPPWQSVTTEN